MNQDEILKQIDINADYQQEDKVKVVVKPISM